MEKDKQELSAQAIDADTIRRVEELFQQTKAIAWEELIPRLQSLTFLN